MAEPESWPAIRDHGLLSTSALLSRYGIRDDARAAIEAQHRPECVTIGGTGLPNAVVRDQKPMSDGALSKCLEDGLAPVDWYRMLNARTFFWLSRDRLRRLLNARAYRDRPQTVLTLETRSLVKVHASRTELSAINSGSTLFNAVPRGTRTLQAIDDYDYELWRKKRGAKDAVVELVVRDSVPDVKDHVVAVHDFASGKFSEIWRRSGADPSIGP